MPVPGTVAHGLPEANVLAQELSRAKPLGPEITLSSSAAEIVEGEPASAKLHRYQQRQSRDKPPLIIIEKKIFVRLLALSRNAICVYLALTRFANQYTGHAYPGLDAIAREVGFVPNHTDFLSGRKRAHLTKKQRDLRDNKTNYWHSEITRAIEECIATGLIRTGAFYNSVLQASYPGYYLLHEDGRDRTRRSGFGKNPFVLVSVPLFEEGFFWITRGHWKRRTPLPSENALRVMLLAMRDNDRLHFGGVDWRQLSMCEGEIECSGSTWCAELNITEQQCIDAVTELIRSNYLHPMDIVVHRDYGHIIRTQPEAEAMDEINVVIFRVNG